MQDIHSTEDLQKKTGCSDLTKLGWSSFFQQQYAQAASDSLPARVVGVHRQLFAVMQGNEVFNASLAGRLQIRADGLFPVVGDWVLVKEQVITDILLRKNLLYRKAAGGRSGRDGQVCDQQGIAANLDHVFIVGLQPGKGRKIPHACLPVWH